MATLKITPYVLFLICTSFMVAPNALAQSNAPPKLPIVVSSGTQKNLDHNNGNVEKSKGIVGKILEMFLWRERSVTPASNSQSSPAI